MIRPLPAGLGGRLKDAWAGPTRGTGCAVDGSRACGRRHSPGAYRRAWPGAARVVARARPGERTPQTTMADVRADAILTARPQRTWPIPRSPARAWRPLSRPRTGPW